MPTPDATRNAMAKEYFEKLSSLISTLELQNAVESQLEVKHFFSGAALYCNGRICASWSPAGLAFKLPGQEADSLIEDGEAVPLRYFPNGNIKSGYALFTNPEEHQDDDWKRYFLRTTTLPTG